MRDFLWVIFLKIPSVLVAFQAYLEREGEAIFRADTRCDY